MKIGSQLLSGSFHPVNDEEWDHGHFDGVILTSLRRTNIIADASFPLSSNSDNINLKESDDNQDEASEAKKTKNTPKWWNDSSVSELTKEIEQTKSIRKRALQVHSSMP
jgi:hypothetical protein